MAMHIKDNIYCEKLPNGGVRIFKSNEAVVDQEGFASPVNLSLTAEDWASVIATMSYYGEEDYGFYRALNFHRGDPVPESCPLVNKLPEDNA